MSLDSQARAFLDQLATLGGPKLWEMAPQAARELYRGMSQLTDPQDVPIGKVENLTAKGPAGEIPIRTYTPVAAGGTAVPALIYYHGGGFVIGDLETHDALCRMLANEAGCKVISVDYRLAPEHPFPAAVEDAYGAARWVEENASDLGIDPNRIAVAGDSAGGNLAAVVCQLAREKDKPSIAFQLLIYPATEVNAQTESMRANAEGYFLEKGSLDWFMGHYIPRDADPKDPRLSPLLAEDLSGLPPAYIVTAGFDPLRDEGKAYAERLKAAGVEAEYVEYKGMIHGFFNMAGVLEVAKQAITDAGAAVKKALEA
jgi:acetyl esterase